MLTHRRADALALGIREAFQHGQPERAFLGEAALVQLACLNNPARGDVKGYRVVADGMAQLVGLFRQPLPFRGPPL